MYYLKQSILYKLNRYLVVFLTLKRRREIVVDVRKRRLTRKNEALSS